MWKEAEINNNNAVGGGAIWHIAYYSFKWSNKPVDIWCFFWSKIDWMQEGGLDPATNDQIVWMCEVASTLGH